LPTSKPGQQTVLPASIAIPRASGSGAGLGKTTVVLSRVTGQSQGHISAKRRVKMWSRSGTSYHGRGNGGTRLSARLLSRGQELFCPEKEGGPAALPCLCL